MKYLSLSAFLLVFVIACGGSGNESNHTPAAESSEAVQQQSTTITKDVDATTFKELMESKSDAQIIDVRTPEEVNAGMIANAEHMDIYDQNFRNNLETLDKEKPVLVYCAAGGRSAKAMQMMSELGFKEVYNLSGGYRGWKAKGLPTTK